MLSGGCETAQFDNPTYRSVGEELLISPLGGAIAYIGGTAGGGYGYDYKYTVGFFTGLDNSGVLGAMHAQGLREAYRAAFLFTLVTLSFSLFFLKKVRIESKEQGSRDA